MTLTAWVLIVFVRSAYAGGAVSIEMPTESACQRALIQAKAMGAFQDAICINRRDDPATMVR